MDEKRQDDQLEPTYNSSVPIRDVTLRTCRKRWTIEKGNGRESGICMLMARHDNDGTRGVMVIVVGNEHGDTSSNPGRD